MNVLVEIEGKDPRAERNVFRPERLKASIYKYSFDRVMIGLQVLVNYQRREKSSNFNAHFESGKTDAVGSAPLEDSGRFEQRPIVSKVSRTLEQKLVTTLQAQPPGSERLNLRQYGLGEIGKPNSFEAQKPFMGTTEESIHAESREIQWNDATGLDPIDEQQRILLVTDFRHLRKWHAKSALKLDSAHRHPRDSNSLRTGIIQSPLQSFHNLGRTIRST
jgi:hypothetical protein